MSSNRLQLRRAFLPAETTVQRAGLLLFVLLVFSPVLVLAGNAVLWLAEAGPWQGLLTLPSGRRLILLLRSVALSLGTVLLSSGIGLLAATWLWQQSGRWARRLRWLVFAPAVIPPCVHALTWMSLATRTDVSVIGFGSALLVQTLAVMPLSAGMALLGLQMVDPRLAEAARSLRTDLVAYAGVVLPLAAPAVLAGAAMVFLLTLVDYTIPSLFQVNVLALDIFADYSTWGDAGRTLVLASPLLAVAALGVWLLAGTLCRSGEEGTPSGAELAPLDCWPPWFSRLQLAAVVILLLQVLVPLVTLACDVDGLSGLWSSLVRAQGEIRCSLAIGGWAVLIAVPLAMPLALQLARRNGWFWWLVVAVPFAIPPALTGIGLVELWNRPGLQAVYTGSSMPVLAALARFTPLAALIISARVRRIDPLLIDAARVFGRSRAQLGLRIWVPLLAPAMVAAGCVVLLFSLGELGATLVVAPPGSSTLTLRIYGYLHSGASSEVAGLSLLILLVTVTGGCIATLAMGGRAR